MLQRDLKQRRPFASREEEAYLNLVRTADLLSREVAAVLKRHQLSEAQYNVLRILRGASQAGVTCREIGERMIHRDPDVTRLLDRLVEQGLATRQRDERDRRVVVTRITDEARELLRRVDPHLDGVVRRTLGPLGEPRLRRLAALLQSARELVP